MAFLVATSRNTGDLITADIWNQDVVDNPNFLKGLAGQIVFDDGAEFAGSVVPNLDVTHDLGSPLKRWNVIHAVQVIGSGFALSNARRTVIVNWEDKAAKTNIQVDITETAGTFTERTAGTGQDVLRMADGNVFGSVRIDQLTESAASASPNDGFDNSWLPARDPYFRCEFTSHGPVPTPAHLIVTLGLRVTPGSTSPIVAEEHAILVFNGITWETESSAGSSLESNDVTAFIAPNQRHVIEIVFINNGASIEFFIDGVLRATHTAQIPSAAQEWTLMLESDGTGGAGQDTRMTLGRVILQEDLA